MSTAIVLMEKDNAFKAPISKPIKVFFDWDAATLVCADKNFSSTSKEYYYLQEVPCEEKLDPDNVWITHSGEEILIQFGEDTEVFANVTLEQDVEEELYHQEMPPHTKPTYKIDKITICGTELDNLKISDELKRKIRHEAENYRDEMIEEIGEPQDD